VTLKERIYKVEAQIQFMEVRADLHCHGPNEWRYNPAKWNPRNLARLVEGRLTAVGIAEMTETDKRFEMLKLACKNDPGVDIDGNEIYVPKYGVVLFRTEEIATQKNGKPQGHVLVFGNKNKIISGSLDEVLDKANEQGAVVIADHAFTGGNNSITGICAVNSPDKILKYFADGKIHSMEYNGSLASFSLFNMFFDSNARNQMAVDFARKNNIYLTASTDAHCVAEMIGERAHTLFDVPDSPYLTEYPMMNDVDSMKIALRTPGNKIVPVMKPGPAFYLDKHIGHIAALMGLSKLGYNPDKHYLKLKK